MPNVPPSDTELETVCLGAAILERGAFEKICDLLKPEMFYKPAHVKIYEAIRNLKQNHEPIDSITLVGQLKKDGNLEEIGGIHYIANLTSRVSSSANLEHWAYSLMELWVLREQALAAAEFREAMFDLTQDVFDAELEYSRKLLKIKLVTERSKTSNMVDETMSGLAQLEKLKSNPNLRGVAFPFKRIAKNLPYLSKGDYTIIAADTGVGKSALALNILMAVKAGIMFSYEMTNYEQWKRALAMTCFINSKKFLEPHKMSEAEWERVIHSVDKMQLPDVNLCDDPRNQVEKIHSECVRLTRKKELPLIIIDYLQLIPNGKGQANDNFELEYISGYLKSIAMDLQTHVIALSQFKNRANRNVRATEDDLRGSGKIKQDANNIILIHRIDIEDQQSLQLWDDLIYSWQINADDPINYVPLLSEYESKRFDKMIITLAKTRGTERGISYPFYYHKATCQFFEIEDLTPSLINALINESVNQKRDDTALLNENNFNYENQEYGDNTPLDF